MKKVYLAMEAQALTTENRGDYQYPTYTISQKVHDRLRWSHGKFSNATHVIDIKAGSTATTARQRLSSHRSSYGTNQSYGLVLDADSVIYEKEFKNYLTREQKVINTIRLFALKLEETGKYIVNLHHAPAEHKNSNPDPYEKGIDKALLKFLGKTLSEKVCGGKHLPYNKSVLQRNLELLEKIKKNIEDSKSNIKEIETDSKEFMHNISDAMNPSVDDIDGMFPRYGRYACKTGYRRRMSA
tara:strand:+ start:220 stop:942 length:723 start_codon:yes stop_codon:yes gene_type:complete